MTSHIKGFVLKDGKLVKKKSRKTPVQHARERKSKKQTVISRAKAISCSGTFGAASPTKK